jgi:hypothetical protein
VAVFEQRWIPAIRDIPFPGRAAVFSKKSMVGVASGAGAVCVILFLLIAFGNPDAAALTGGREIVFEGNDCECGHINPQSADIEYLIAGDSTPTWQILSEADGTVIFTGSTAELNAKLRQLSDARQDARYTLRGTLLNKKGNEVILERPFTIGNYSGDANN